MTPDDVVVEFTLTTDGALELIAEFAQRDDVVVGAGTVLTVDDARAAVDAGARFLVSPVVDEAVIAEAHALGVAVLPGCYTPTELLRAHRAGRRRRPRHDPLPARPAAVLAPRPHQRRYTRQRRRLPRRRGVRGRLRPHTVRPRRSAPRPLRRHHGPRGRHGGQAPPCNQLIARDRLELHPILSGWFCSRIGALLVGH